MLMAVFARGIGLSTVVCTYQQREQLQPDVFSRQLNCGELEGPRLVEACDPVPQVCVEPISSLLLVIVPLGAETRAQGWWRSHPKSQQELTMYSCSGWLQFPGSAGGPWKEALDIGHSGHGGRRELGPQQ